MASTPASSRLLALDWLRGLVMVLMAVDHCDAMVNSGHAAGDSVWMVRPGPLFAGDFLTRFASHLCAPTFAFLGGAGMALSVAGAVGRGESTGAIDRHWLLRGLVLLLLEVFVLSFCWRLEEPLDVVLQVLWALGGGFLLLVPLRRAASPPLLLLALALPLLLEFVYQPVHYDGAVVAAPAWNGLLWSGGVYEWAGLRVLVLYPLLPWLTPMLLGFVFGRWLASAPAPQCVERLLLTGGAVALLSFAVVRGLRGFGNAQLQRRDASWLEWLHCSKYPPSLSFFALELGGMALLLALLQRLARMRRERPLRFDPLLVLGQVPLFFYLLHLLLIGALVRSGIWGRGDDWRRSWPLAACVVLLALLPCALYRRYKRRGAAWTRYL